VRQRTMMINAIRGHCAEFGLVTPHGPRRVMELMEQVRNGGVTALPEIARSALLLLGDQLAGLALLIHSLERRLLAWHRQDRARQRLASIPGVGLISATALSASVTDPSLFRSGASSPPSGAWSHLRTPLVARIGSVASPRRATGIFANCWWLEQRRLSAGRKPVS
jgi:transposase